MEEDLQPTEEDFFFVFLWKKTFRVMEVDLQGFGRNTFLLFFCRRRPWADGRRPSGPWKKTFLLTEEDLWSMKEDLCVTEDLFYPHKNFIPKKIPPLKFVYM